MSDFNFLLKNVQIKGDIDERFFRQVGDEVRYAPALIKVIANDAVEYFKEKIFELDAENKYSFSKTTMITDDEATRQAKEPYKDKYEKFNRLWDEYKTSHETEFVEEWRASGVETAALHKMTIGFNPDLSLSLLDAVAAFKAAKELKARYASGGDEYDSLPKYVTLVSKQEYVQAHNDLRAKWREDLGLPEKDSDLTVKVESETKSINGRAIKTVVDNDEYIEEFAKQYVEYIQG